MASLGSPLNVFSLFACAFKISYRIKTQELHFHSGSPSKTIFQVQEDSWGIIKIILVIESHYQGFKSQPCPFSNCLLGKSSCLNLTVLIHMWVCVQSCPTLCDPMDWSQPGFSVHRISQARILKWVAISYSRGFSQPRDETFISCHGRLKMEIKRAY